MIHLEKQKNTYFFIHAFGCDVLYRDDHLDDLYWWYDTHFRLLQDQYGRVWAFFHVSCIYYHPHRQLLLLCLYCLYCFYCFFLFPDS